ncbi:MAG: RluA family pseudouridine synthase [Nitrospinaceae bacterium]
MAPLYQPPPTEQVYGSHLPGRFTGFSLANYLAARFPFQPAAAWLTMILQGRVSVNGAPAGPERVLRLHDFIETRMGVREEPPVDRSLSLIYEDRHLRVFNKGAPLPVHPCGRYFENSMTELLKRAYPAERPRPVQRLDAVTTGLQVFARTRRAAADLMFAFQNNRVDKEYLALVEGVPRQTRFEVDLPIGKVQGSARGVGPAVLNPKPARTRFQWLGHRHGLSLLRVRPLTGRTNQIRVHLAALGLPLFNDPVYGNGAGARPPFGLHALHMQFVCLGRRVRLTAAAPDHFQEVYEFARPRLA